MIGGKRTHHKSKVHLSQKHDTRGVSVWGEVNCANFGVFRHNFLFHIVKNVHTVLYEVFLDEGKGFRKKNRAVYSVVGKTRLFGWNKFGQKAKTKVKKINH